MRKLLTISIILLPFCIQAQGSFDIRVNGGLNTSFKFARLKSSLLYGAANGYNSGAQLMYNAESWQVGAGLETGTLTGSVYRLAFDGRHIQGGTAYNNQKIAKPYYTPHLLFNYKAWLSRGTYLYMGGIGGYSFTSTDLTWNKKGTGFIAGANIGIAIKITKTIRIDICEGWRQIWMQNTTPANYEYELTLATSNFNPFPTYVLFVPEEKFKFSFFKTSVGIRFSLFGNSRYN